MGTPELETPELDLMRFAAKVIKAYKVVGDIDCMAMQDIAEECGVFVPVTVTGPCCEDCECAGWSDFPATCLRINEAIQLWMKLKEKG